MVFDSQELDQSPLIGIPWLSRTCVAPFRSAGLVCNLLVLPNVIALDVSAFDCFVRGQFHE